jgi:thioredoxin reductase
MTLDAIVIGGGPAGLSAATWLARYRRRVLVLDSGEYRNRWADASHGYFSRDPANPAELLARARADLDAYPTADVRHARAVKAAPHGDGGFQVVTETGRFAARRLVVATGVRDQFPDVEGFLEHYGASVFHCPSCDGYEAKGRPVVAIGWSEQVVGFALELLGWASQVTVVTDGRRFEGDAEHRRMLERHGVAVREETALELIGTRGDLRAIRLAGGETVECQLGFFSIAHHPLTGLGEQLGCQRDAQGTWRWTPTAPPPSPACTPPATSPPASSSSRWLPAAAPAPAWVVPCRWRTTPGPHRHSPPTSTTGSRSPAPGGSS